MSEQYPPRAMRPDHVEPDPRTDGVEHDPSHDLPPLDSTEIQAGVEHDRDHARRLGEL